MKFFALILALYTLGLSLTPCCDVHEGQRNTPQTVQQSADQQQQDNEPCCPFCQCSCCHGFVAISFIKIIPAVPVFTEKLIPGCQKPIFSSFLSSIWNPPQIS